MAKQLTAKERKTLNDAMDILLRCTPTRASWQIGVQCYHGTHGFDVTYFDSNAGGAQGQHCWVRGENFADKVQKVLEIEADAASNRDQAKAARIEMLRKELANLTEQVPA